MRGYESNCINALRQSPSCYESPCGVMREKVHAFFAMHGQLRIPMRGYEMQLAVSVRYNALVTNPHAGL